MALSTLCLARAKVAEFGRRARFRILWAIALGGSSPPFRTISTAHIQRPAPARESRPVHFPQHNRHPTTYPASPCNTGPTVQHRSPCTMVKTERAHRSFRLRDPAIRWPRKSRGDGPRRGRYGVAGLGVAASSDRRPHVRTSGRSGHGGRGGERPLPGANHAHRPTHRSSSPGESRPLPFPHTAAIVCVATPAPPLRLRGFNIKMHVLW